MKRKLMTGASLGCALLLSAASFGQLSVSNAETLVNNTTASAQQNPAVSQDTAGRYVVVWESELQDGDGFGIYAEIYNADHTVRVPEFQINTNDQTDDQRHPDVDMDVNGNFCVVWQSNEDDVAFDQEWDVYRKIYDIDGTVIAGRSRVNSTTSRNQQRPSVAMNENYVVVAYMSQFGTDAYSVRGRFYDATTGAALQSPFDVMTNSGDHVAHVDVTIDDQGQAIFVWQTDNLDGDRNGIFASGYEQPNTQVFSEVQVNTTTSANQQEPAVAADSAGNAMVVWSSFGQDGSNYGIYSRLMTTAGSFSGSEVLVNSTTADAQDHARVEASRQGTRFVVTWTDETAAGDGGQGVMARHYEAGAFQGSDSLINATTNGRQMLSDVSIGSDNYDAIIAWQGGNRKDASSGADNDDFGVYVAAASLVDNTPPTPVCQNITVYLDGTGNVSITGTDVDGGSTDNVGIVSYSLNTSSFNCSDIGSNFVVLTVADAAGNSAACGATVTVLDTVSPTAVCQDITIYLDGAGTASITTGDIDGGSSDNCSIASLAASQTSFTCANVGANNVTLTVTDGSGNISSCTSVVTVVDSVTPTAVCQDITVYLDGTGNATITGADLDGGSSDNCSGTFTYGLSQSSFTCADIGANSVTLTVTDPGGNSAACSSTVTVIDSVTPTAVCQNITVYLDGSGNATITAADVDGGSTDNCGAPTLGIDVSAFTCANIGANTVTLTATDGSGNVGSCTATVTIIDSISPTALCQDLTVYLDGAGTATITTGDVDAGSSDNCGIAGLSLSQSSFTCANVGANTVTLTVTDGSGNIGTCSSTVTVLDTISPVALCQNLTVYLDGTGNATITTGDVDAGSIDNCSIASLALSQSSFTCADAGANSVTLTVTDASGNIGTCSSLVTVIDSVTPTAVCQNITVYLDGSGNATITAADVDGGSTDNCGAPTLGIDVSAFTCANIGTNNVTLTATDGSGNVGSCTAVVTVADTTSPVTPTLSDLTAECSVTATAPTTTDNCAGTVTGTTTDPLTYTSEGTYVITWTFDDGNGNTTNATQNVIIDDVTAPVTPTLADLTDECTVTATAPTTTDNCAGTVTGTTTDPLTYTSEGTYVITWTFDDGNGNTTTATQNVIIDDVTAPVTPTLADLTDECTVTATAPTTTDNCAGTVTGTTTDPLTYTGEGTYVITWTFDDGNGNTTTATQNVIIDDVTAPVTPTLADLTDECTVTATAPTTTDNCAGTVTGTTTDPLTYTGEGTYVITWTFDDGNGNTTTATQNVIIDDVTAPVTPTLADLTDECTVTVTAPTTTDNCAGTITGTTTDPLTYTGDGSYIITWTFDDGNGNTTTATQNVIIDDVTAPVTPTLADLTDECTVTATAPTTTDNCAGTVTGTTTDPLTYTGEGSYIITWTFDDGNGNATTATQNVIIDDVTAPVTPTLADVTGECTATATVPTTTDNCAGTVTGTTTDPLTYTGEGTYVITWTFDDGNGNTTTATQNVIIDDVTAPVTPTLADLTDECTVTATAPTTTDNCAGTVTGTTTDPLTYTGEGTYVITWTFDDGNGNTTTATQNVIIDDVTAPVTPTLADLTDECSVTATAPTTTDNCAGTVTGTTTDPLTYTGDGTYVITWTFDDGNGNTTTATQNVIIDDVTAPVTPTLTDITAECTATATAPTTTDNCAGTVTGTTTDPLTYTAQGSYVITWTFDDGNGNTTTATQNVIVDDVTAPVTPTLADLTDECSVTATAPTTTDNCAGTVTGTTTDPLTYTGEGTYVITWTFDDGNGNTTTATQNVIIDDVTAPVTPTLADITAECTATATAPTTTDNCAGTVTGTTTDPLTYTGEGTYVITWTFDDGNGNTTTATQNVIIDDVTAPVTPTLADLTDECSVTATAPTTTDNCAGTVTGTTTDPLTYNSQGTFVITWTFDDGNGNTATATQNVIISDVTLPTASNIDTAYAECIGDVPVDVTLVDDEADNCGVPTVTYVGDLASNGTGCGDTITRTYNVADDAGNNIDVTQIIILNDVTPPTASNPVTLDVVCLADVPTAAGATAWVTDEADNCGTPTVAWVSDVSSNGTGCNDTITRTFSVTDNCGNSITVQQLIIIHDDIAPVADNVALADITETCESTPTAPTATDNCAGALNGVPDVSFPITTVGTTVITWTYTDNCGNTTTQTQNVTITGVDVSTTMASDGITMVASNQNAGVTYQWIDCETNAPVAGATNYNFTPTYGSDFAVIVTENGCSDTSACVNSTVSLDQIAFDEFMLYPNPTTGQFKVSFNGVIKSIEMIDVTGRIVLTETSLNEGLVDASLLAPGKYMVRLTANNGNIHTKPIVIGQQ